MTELKTGTIVWTDATSYSRDQKERVPTAWQTKVGKCRIYITNGHIYYRGIWIVSCHELGIENKRLEAPDVLHKIAIEAIRICKSKADELSSSFKNLRLILKP